MLLRQCVLGKIGSFTELHNPMYYLGSGGKLYYGDMIQVHMKKCE